MSAPNVENDQVATPEAAPAAPSSAPDIGSAEFRRLLEMETERVLGEQLQQGLVEHYMGLEGGSEMLMRRARDLSTARLIAMQRTQPTDWVLNAARDGEMPVAMLRNSGCRHFAEVFGVSDVRIVPRSADGQLRPIREACNNDSYNLTVYVSGRSRLTGQVAESIPVTVNSKEDFTGRSASADGSIVRRAEDRDHTHDPDLLSSLRTRAESKLVRVLCNVGRVAVPEIEAAYKAVNRSLDFSAKGHGYGSAQARSAQTASGGAAAVQAEALWTEILKRTGGDPAAARECLKRVTSFTKRDGSQFAGYDDHKRITSEKMAELALKKLADDPTFGDHPEPGSGG